MRYEEVSCEKRVYYKAIKVLVKKAEIILFAMLIIFLLAALAPMKVSGSGAGAAEKESFHELEMRFLDVLDVRLQECGYSGSGLTLNSIIYADGSRCYYVGIHHARITEGGAEAWEELKLQITDISVPVENCSVVYKIVP